MKRSYIPALSMVATSWAATALVLAGCASAPPPMEDIARADATINLAEQSNARNHAPLELDSARQKLSQARGAMAREDYAAARRLAEQAQVEAELAQAKSQSAVAQQSLQQVRESIRILRKEIGRGAPVGAGVY
ncbi:MAG TPA: DUF4398 domain-containing protein [Gammaproteobacteria bacterium]|nr:DUF4398 domain-containing protein [Gammaproteobacteria bacterium]